MNLFRWKILSTRDLSFRKLFEVLLSRIKQEDVAKFLDGYKYLNEGTKSEYGFTQELYYKDNTAPGLYSRILSDKGVPFYTSIRIVYPAKISGVSMSFPRNSNFTATSRIMENLFGKIIVENGVPFYQKEDIAGIVSKSDEKDKLSVKVDIYDTSKFPFETVKTDYLNKQGSFVNRV